MAEQQKVIEKANAIRLVHPMIGCRKIGYMLRSNGNGRDKIERLLLANGYRVKYAPNYARTTYSVRQHYYPNLIEGMELTGINQLIQTDISYYWVNGKFYYLTFIIDVYSRRIIGHYTATSLEATANIKALQMAIRTRSNDLRNVVHHSDRGSQYIDKRYRKLLASHQMRISMCKEAWENAYTERINRTIKEEYLNAWSISSYKELVSYVNKAVKAYNNRPHSSLQMMSPVDFENHIKMPGNKCLSKMQIYKNNKSSLFNNIV